MTSTATDRPLRVVIGEDDVLLREGIARILVDAGIEVVRIAGSELGSGRGGPRCMSCPIDREPLPAD